MSNAVGDVGEFIRLKGIEILEYAVLEYLAVEGGYAVDLVADRHAEVGHPDDAV